MNSLDQLKEQAELEGRYQDIEVHGEKVITGWRNCEDRWAIIEPYVFPNTTIMDIGSHYGFFSIKCAMKPDTLVWSFESQKERAGIQAAAIEANGLQNLVLSDRHLQLQDFVRLSRTTEKVDLILALSVMHYYTPQELPDVLWSMSQISQNVIIEAANPNESEVANKEWIEKIPMERLLDSIFDSVTVIGETPAPKDKSVNRKIYLCQRYEINRTNLVGYPQAIGGRKHEMKYHNAAWTIDGKHIDNGLNLFGLSHYGVIYPSLKTLVRGAATHYWHLINKKKGRVTDVHPRNVLVTHTGHQIIDYKEGVGEDIYGKTWDEYRDLIRSFDEEQLFQHLWEQVEKVDQFAVLNDKGRQEFQDEA